MMALAEWYERGSTGLNHPKSPQLQDLIKLPGIPGRATIWAPIPDDGVEDTE